VSCLSPIRLWRKDRHHGHILLILSDLGWSDAFQSQWDDPDLTPLRIAEVHRTRMLAIGEDGPCDIVAPHQDSAAYAVGDWVLVNHAKTVQRLLDRVSVLDRITAARDGTGAATQLIAANVDTLFITTSCNADFNVARLERYLALAAGAGCLPVVILTKADGTDNPESYRQQTLDLQRGLDVVTLDARDPHVAHDLAPWCYAGQTVALVGSSGVGKSTLTNTLTGDALETGAIREADGRGRHTTRFRALRPMVQGGWIIDTPGMRALQLHAPDGIDTVFAEIDQGRQSVARTSGAVAQAEGRRSGRDANQGTSASAPLQHGRQAEEDGEKAVRLAQTSPPTPLRSRRGEVHPPSPLSPWERGRGRGSWRGPKHVTHIAASALTPVPPNPPSCS
jgi:ribosome biogenesis GTPase / thiamine phosphate phosphatase